MAPTLTPEQALALTKPTAGFECELTDNFCQLEFHKFTVRKLDIADGGKAEDLLTVGDTDGMTEEQQKAQLEELQAALKEDPDSLRRIKYPFGRAFLQHRAIGTELEFTVGDTPVKQLRMIETHFFRDRVLKRFDFEMPFCIPGSKNTWEVIYEMPELTPAEEAEIAAEPWQVSSDSFYFVEGKLVMHTKAEYDYSC